MTKATLLSLAFALGAGACATQPSAPPNASAAAMQYTTLNFEHLESSEVILFTQTAEREFGWEVASMTGGSGSMTVSVNSPGNGASTYAEATQIMSMNGYNLDVLQISSTNNSITIDRIIEDGFRPGR